MGLKPLNDLGEFTKDRRVRVRAEKFQELWDELEQMELPLSVSSFINSEVDHLNSLDDKGAVFRQLGSSQSAILKLLKEELDLIPSNYYRNQWVALGMVVFGVPLGTILGLSLQNMAFIGVGLPIGLAIGIGVGISLDKRAREEGRQLNFEA